jgi:Fe-S-cluster-containing dehydrogenase component
MGPYGWLFDSKKCIECRACEAACKQWNQVQTGKNIRYRQVRISESGVFPRVSRLALSLACNHCENALCSRACPAKAIKRRSDGLVYINRDECQGCGMCVKFCPYEAPQFDAENRKMEKCTGCWDRIDAGLAPACVTLCPTGALQWGEWTKIASQGVDELPGFKYPGTTRPRIRFVTAGWTAK